MISPFLNLAILPDIGGGEMMLIMFVVLLLFGGDKMPQMAKSLAKTITQFKKAANEVEREIKRAIDEVPDVPDIKSTLLSATEDRPKPAPAIPVSLPPAPPPADIPFPAEPQPAPNPAATPDKPAGPAPAP